MALTAQQEAALIKAARSNDPEDKLAVTIFLKLGGPEGEFLARLLSRRGHCDGDFSDHNKASRPVQTK